MYTIMYHYMYLQMYIYVHVRTTTCTYTCTFPCTYVCTGRCKHEKRICAGMYLVLCRLLQYITYKISKEKPYCLFILSLEYYCKEKCDLDVAL